jgi:hypothetical protein
MKATPGSKVYLKLSGRPRQWYTIVYCGPQSVRLKCDDDSTLTVSRNKVRFQLGISTSPRIRVISTPMGGKPKG